MGGFRFLTPVATTCDRTRMPAAHQDVPTSFRWSFQHGEHRVTCRGARQDHDAARRVEAARVFTVNCPKGPGPTERARLQVCYRNGTTACASTLPSGLCILVAIRRFCWTLVTVGETHKNREAQSDSCSVLPLL